MRKRTATPPMSGNLIGTMSEHLSKMSAQLTYNTRAPLWIYLDVNNVRQLKFKIRDYLNAHEPQND